MMSKSGYGRSLFEITNVELHHNIRPVFAKCEEYSKTARFMINTDAGHFLLDNGNGIGDTFFADCNLDAKDLLEFIKSITNVYCAEGGEWIMREKTKKKEITMEETIVDSKVSSIPDKEANAATILDSNIVAENNDSPIPPLQSFVLGLNVQELKEIINRWPSKNAEGEDNKVGIVNTEGEFIPFTMTFPYGYGNIAFTEEGYGNGKKEFSS